jgi:flagellar biosynthesis/type III secretory pathway protein FliH
MASPSSTLPRAANSTGAASSESTSTELFDLDDLLEQANLSETKIFEQGVKEGLEEGHRQAAEEGWIAGLAQGVGVGLDLGEQLGFAKYISEAVSSSRLKLASPQEEEKVKKICDQIVGLVEGFPLTNVDEVDLAKLADDIRAKTFLLRDSLKLGEDEPNDNSSAGQKYSF